MEKQNLPQVRTTSSRSNHTTPLIRYVNNYDLSNVFDGVEALLDNPSACYKIIRYELEGRIIPTIMPWQDNIEKSLQNKEIYECHWTTKKRTDRFMILSADVSIKTHTERCEVIVCRVDNYFYVAIECINKYDIVGMIFISDRILIDVDLIIHYSSLECGIICHRDKEWTTNHITFEIEPESHATSVPDESQVNLTPIQAKISVITERSKKFSEEAMKLADECSGLNEYFQNETKELIKDNKTLKDQNLKQEKEIRTLKEEIDKLKAENAELRERTDSMKPKAQNAVSAKGVSHQKASTPFRSLVLYTQRANEIMTLLHELVESQTKVKAIMQPICAAVEAGVIKRPDIKQFCEEFKDKRVSPSSFNNYLKDCHTLHDNSFNVMKERFESLK